MAAAPLLLCSCAAVDQFSSRAATYNDQAETIKEQQLLVNILRSAYREPQEFSDFTQVTGQASVSGTAAFTLPIATFPATLARTDVASPAGTLSGAQSFTVANLDTQDFYEGILSPIPLTSVDYYMEADYPKALVLTLFVSHIRLKPQGGQGPEIAFTNSYYGDYPKFEAVVQTAIDLGLTTETVNKTKEIGPAMTAAQLPAVKDLASVIGPGVALRTYQITPTGEMPHDAGLTPAELLAYRRSGVPEYYRLESHTPVSRFCFAAPMADASALAQVSQDLLAAGVIHDGTSVAAIKFPPQALCNTGSNSGSNSAAADTGDDDTEENAPGVEIDFAHGGQVIAAHYRVAITTRSVEEILYYLGEWTRGELQIDGSGSATIPQIRTGWQGGNDILFQMRQDCDPLSPHVDASLFGHDYCMDIDPSGHDRSSEVMEIVSQLFALNNSAKNLPAPNVISVLSQ
jgi:hypothetical protein